MRSDGRNKDGRIATYVDDETVLNPTHTLCTCKND